MRPFLLACLVLIGGWCWAQVGLEDPPRTKQLVLGLVALVLLTLAPIGWRRLKTRRERLCPESHREQGEEKGRTSPDRRSDQTSGSAPPEDGTRQGPSVLWEEAEEEEVEEEKDKLSLLVLQDFYATQVYKGRHDPPHDCCDLVKGLVDTLIKRIQTFGKCSEAVLERRCRGVGSMFEGWGVSRGDQVPVYDVLITLVPPPGLAVDVELGWGESTLLCPTCSQQAPDTAPLRPPLPLLEPQPSRPTLPLDVCLLAQPLARGAARVFVRTDPAHSSARLRSFSSRSRLSDFVERARVERIREGLDYMLEECLMLDQHMEPVRVLSWLGSALRRAWVAHGGLKVGFWGREWPCVMRVESSVGHVLYINVIPAVRLPDSDVCVVARGAVRQPWSEFWEPWFCSDEDYFLRTVTSRLPGNSCHMLCLEILSFLNRPVAQFSTQVVSFLSSYHLKTLLLWLLWQRGEAQAWDGAYLVERLAEMLELLQGCLARRELMCFWTANSSLGALQPRPLLYSPPLNLFSSLLQSKASYALAIMEFHRLRARLRELPCSSGVGCLVPREALGVVREASAPNALSKRNSGKLRAGLRGKIKRSVVIEEQSCEESVVPSPAHPLHGLHFRFFPVNPK